MDRRPDARPGPPARLARGAGASAPPRCRTPRASGSRSRPRRAPRASPSTRPCARRSARCPSVDLLRRPRRGHPRRAAPGRDGVRPQRRPGSATRRRRRSRSRTPRSRPTRSCARWRRSRDARHELPAMVNAHSHAFQRDLRGAAERPAPEAHAADDFWSWREAMFRLAGDARPGLDARRRRPRLRRDGRGRLRRGRRVPLRPPPARRHALRGPERDGRSPSRRPRARPGCAIVLLPAAYHRAGWDGGDLPPSAGQRRFCDPDVEAFLARVDALRAWAEGRDGRLGRRGRAQRPRRPRRPGSRRSPPTPTRTASSATCTPTSSRARSPSAAPSTAVSPVALLARTGFLGPRTSVVHGIHVTPADIGLLAESGTIVVSCPTTEGSLGDGQPPALAYRDAGVRLALGSDSQVRVDPFEETRELETLARREGGTRHALLAALRRPVGGAVPRRPREPRARRRRRRGGHDRRRPRPPRPARRRGRGPAARGRDVRVGRGGVPAGAELTARGRRRPAGRRARAAARLRRDGSRRVGHELEHVVQRSRLEQPLHGRRPADEHEPMTGAARAAARGQQAREAAGVEEVQLAQVDHDARAARAAPRGAAARRTRRRARGRARRAGR